MRHPNVKRSGPRLIAFLIILGIITLPAVFKTQSAAAQDTLPTASQGSEVDPWEPFNASMFWFNHDVLDRYVLKPVAQAWSFVLPDMARRSLRNAVDNTNVLPRLVNSLAQGK